MKAQILHFDSNRPKTRKCQPPTLNDRATELAQKLDRLIRLGVSVEGLALQIDRLEQRASG